jgi:hypothetical protein
MKTLIVTIFDRKLFSESVEMFDKFEKFFAELGPDVTCVNVDAKSSMITQIKNHGSKPDFVMFYCCCRGATYRYICMDQAIQIENSKVYPLSALQYTAVEGDLNVPILVIAECGRELCYGYGNKLKLTHKHLFRCFTAKERGNICVSNDKFQKILYDKLKNFTSKSIMGMWNDLKECERDVGNDYSLNYDHSYNIFHDENKMKVIDDCFVKLFKK